MHSTQHNKNVERLRAFLSRPRVFLALSAARHAGGPPVNCDTHLGPGRVPWCVLWVSRITPAGIFKGTGFRFAEPRRTMETHTISSESRKQPRLKLLSFVTAAGTTATYCVLAGKASRTHLRTHTPELSRSPGPASL